MPTVSIIIPIYNVEPYIRECLQSVMEQTLTEGLECILVDDCGTDKSMDIAQQMVDEYNGNIDFRIIHHEKNRGLSAARNTAIKAATGDFLFFLDSDDYLFSNSIDVLYKYTIKYRDVDLVQGIVSSNDKEMNKWTHLPLSYNIPEFVNNKKDCRHLIQSYKINMMMQNTLYKRSLIQKYKLSCKQGIVHEDALWTFIVGRFVKSFVLCRKETYFYRVRTDSIMSQKDKGDSIRSLCEICDYILNSIDTADGYEDELNSIMYLLSTAKSRNSSKSLPSIRQMSNLFFRCICAIEIEKRKVPKYSDQLFRKAFKFHLKFKRLIRF